MAALSWRWAVTAQFANRILLNGEPHLLLSAPESNFLSGLTPAPRFAGSSTALRRGYVADWAVRADNLYLLNVVGTVCDKVKDDKALPSYWCKEPHLGKCDYRPITLPDLCAAPPDGILAVWYSGSLRVARGEVVRHVHAGWASTYKNEICLQVRQGKVVAERVLFMPRLAWLAKRGGARGASFVRRMIDAFRSRQ